MDLTHITGGVSFFAIFLLLAGIAGAFLAINHKQILWNIFPRKKSNGFIVVILLAILIFSPIVISLFSLDFFGTMNPVDGLKSFYEIVCVGQPYARVEDKSLLAPRYLVQDLKVGTIDDLIKEAYGSEYTLGQSEVYDINYDGKFETFKRWEVHKNGQGLGAIQFEKKGFYYLIQLPEKYF